MVTDWLKPSATVDLSQLLFLIRPAMRTELRRPVAPEVVQRFAWSVRRFSALDQNGFLVLSKSPALSQRILSLDRAPDHHTFLLGRALGYPRCCCLAAARVGDRGLDVWAAEVGAQPFHGRFKAIDPRGYRDGHALISHVPCSARCLPSLAMALELHGCLRRRQRRRSRVKDRIVSRAQLDDNALSRIALSDRVLRTKLDRLLGGP
jgi:hypothetical protein